MLISSIVQSLLASGACGHACPRGLWSDFCLCALCVHEQFVMWHVYVFTCIGPLLSPRHPPGEWGEVGRLKIAPGSLNTGSQNISAHESHRLSVAPSPSFPLPRALFLLWEYEGLSLNLQADGPCTYWGHMIHVCNRSFGTCSAANGKAVSSIIPTNNNHLWLISIRNDNWLTASALIQNHGRVHGSITSWSVAFNCIFLFNERVICHVFFLC